jgi:Cu(I)/Ag(I) efflux system membrane fusion protein
MKPKLIFTLFVLIASTFWLALVPNKSAAATPAAGDVDYYTCTMHPSVHSKTPGKCPICGMELVPVYKQSATTSTSSIQNESINLVAPEENQPGEFTVPLERQQQIGVTYATVEKQPLQQTIRAAGVVAGDIASRRDFVAPSSGSVISLGVASAGETVEKGQPLLTIYSPDLLNEEQDFATAVQNYLAAPNFGSRRMIGNIQAQYEAAKNRLLLWNLTTNQIAELEKWTTRVPRDTVTIYAPFSGVVQRIGVEPGKKFAMGDEFLELAGLQSVQVWANFYQDELPLLKIGLPVDITSSSWPGETFSGKIAVVDPFLNPDTRTVRVRIDIENPDLKLRPEMYVNVALKIDHGEQLAVPVNAVLPTGEHNIVFVDKGGGKLQPRFIEIGQQYGDYYEVRSGLNEGERIVASGNFLIDAESQIQGALKSW